MRSSNFRLELADKLDNGRMVHQTRQIGSTASTSGLRISMVAEILDVFDLACAGLERSKLGDGIRGRLEEDTGLDTSITLNRLGDRLLPVQLALLIRCRVPSLPLSNGVTFGIY